MRLPSTHFILALIIGILVSIGYGTWYVVVSNKSSEAANLQNKIIMANENTNRIALARAALTKISGDEANVHAFFVSENSVVSFINDLEKRGLSQKTTVKVLSVSKTETSSQPSLLLALSILGTFDAVMNTVGAIEYAPYAISLSTLSLQQEAKNSWHANLTLTVGSTPFSTATSTN